VKRLVRRRPIVVVALGGLLWACGAKDAGKGTSSALPGTGPQEAGVLQNDDAAGGTPADGGAADGVTSDDAAGTAGSGDAGAEGGSVIGDPIGTTAVSLDAFLDSIGVCTHVAQGVDDPAKSATAMTYAGLRNLRDDGNPSAVSSWISMHQSAGIRVCVLSNQNVSSTLDMAKQLNGAGALLAVEGPNEPNNFAVTYMGQTSSSTTFAPVASFQRDLYAAVTSEPSLAGIPVFHSSEAGGSEPDNVGLQFLTIPADAGTTMPAGTRYADYANTHNYVCGHSHQLVDNVAWNASDPTLNADWDGMYVEYGRTWNKGFAGYPNPQLVTLPRVTTETGWVTSGTGAITEEQQARVFLDLYLSAFKQGFSYTFIYMLRDDPNQGYWGLFDTSYMPKTSGTYMHNLTTILAGSGTKTPGKLDYSIVSEPPTVHDLLLQKGDGTFALILWDERFGGGSDMVQVNLGKSREEIQVYDPTMGTVPIATARGASFDTLTLTDHPVIIGL
jgi:hypothetical protein